MTPDSPFPGLGALLALAGCVFALSMMSSCAPKTVVVGATAPGAAHLQASVVAGAVAATRVAGGSVVLRAIAGELSAALAAGMLEASRVRKAGVADQVFLDENAARWQAATVKIGVLEAFAQTAMIDAKELASAAAATSAEAGELSAAAVVHDASVETLKVANASLSEDAVAWRKLKFVGWVLLGCAGVWLFVRYCLPVIIAAAKPPLL